MTSKPAKMLVARHGHPPISVAQDSDDLCTMRMSGASNDGPGSSSVAESLARILQGHVSEKLRPEFDVAAVARAAEDISGVMCQFRPGWHAVSARAFRCFRARKCPAEIQAGGTHELRFNGIVPGRRPTDLRLVCSPTRFQRSICRFSVRPSGRRADARSRQEPAHCRLWPR